LKAALARAAVQAVKPLVAAVSADPQLLSPFVSLKK